ncbi:MAG: hypothetical protein ACXAB6_03510, partial [Candidatus Thorarchaeota archaeon]
MDALGVVVLIVFIATYAIISTEKVNRTGMALLGMGVIGFVFLVAWWMGIQPIQADADAWDHDPFLVLVNTIEWDTVLFVTAMMIIVAVAGGSGMFQYLA